MDFVVTYVLPWAAPLFAGIWFFLGVGSWRYERHRRSRGVVVPGRVVDSATLRVAQGPGEGARFLNAPVVQFYDRDGALRTFTHDSGTNFPVEVGKVVSVRFDPDDPAVEPSVESGAVNGQLFITVVAFGVGTVVLVAWAVWMLTSVL